MSVSKDALTEKSVHEDIQRAIARRIVEIYEPVSTLRFGRMTKSRANGGWSGDIWVNEVDRFFVSFSYDAQTKQIHMVHQPIERKTVRFKQTNGETGMLESVKIDFGELE